MPNRPPAPSLDELVRLFVQASEPRRDPAVDRRVNPDRRAPPSNAGSVIVVVGNGNVIAPSPPPRATKPRRAG